MSVVKPVVLICDCDVVLVGDPGKPIADICHREVTSHKGSVTEARDDAAQLGWSKVRVGKKDYDLCFIHSRHYRNNFASDGSKLKLAVVEDPEAPKPRSHKKKLDKDADTAA